MNNTVTLNKINSSSSAINGIDAEPIKKINDSVTEVIKFSTKKEIVSSAEQIHDSNYIHLEPECAQIINNVIAKVDIPMKKECVLLPCTTFIEIYRNLSTEPAMHKVMQAIQTEMHSSFTGTKRGSKGYLIVDGLYSPEIYPQGINPYNYTSNELAPFDAENNRAYEFNTDLMKNQLKALVAFSCLMGVPFRMFDAKNLIIPVTAHSAVQASKFGGQGPNLLHKDGGFLIPRPSNNSTQPSMGPGTEISTLLCITPDKYGMGINWIVTEDANNIIDALSTRERTILQTEMFHYMPTHGLNDSEGLKKFAILYKNKFEEWTLRFSGKLIEHMDQHWDPKISAGKEEILAILQKVYNALMVNKKDVFLHSGQMICMNQHITFHGRNEVKDSNRILAQLFNRYPYDGGSLLVDKYSSVFRKF